jgi:hypothetical protein
VGHFNNNFKVADDIRQLGAVPEEEEEREVPIDKHMAKAMEERLLKGIEQEMLRDKQSIIRSFMRDSGGEHLSPSPSPAPARLPATVCIPAIRARWSAPDHMHTR